MRSWPGRPAGPNPRLPAGRRLAARQWRAPREPMSEPPTRQIYCSTVVELLACRPSSVGSPGSHAKWDNAMSPPGLSDWALRYVAKRGIASALEAHRAGDASMRPAGAPSHSVPAVRGKRKGRVSLDGARWARTVQRKRPLARSVTVDGTPNRLGGPPGVGSRHESDHSGLGGIPAIPRGARESVSPIARNLPHAGGRAGLECRAADAP